MVIRYHMCYHYINPDPTYNHRNMVRSQDTKVGENAFRNEWIVYELQALPVCPYFVCWLMYCWHMAENSWIHQLSSIQERMTTPIRLSARSCQKSSKMVSSEIPKSHLPFGIWPQMVTLEHKKTPKTISNCDAPYWYQPMQSYYCAICACSHGTFLTIFPFPKRYPRFWISERASRSSINSVN